MIKIYESTTVRNNMSLHLKCGMATVKFDFERGNVAKGIRARYVTNDKFMQHVLDTNAGMGTLYRLAKEIPEDNDDTVRIAEENKLKAKAQAAAEAAYQAVINSRVESVSREAEPPADANGTVATGTDSVQAESTPAESPVQSKGATMKDVAFADASEVIVYVMENYGEQVETLDAATKLLRKHKINPVVG